MDDDSISDDIGTTDLSGVEVEVPAAPFNVSTPMVDNSIGSVDYSSLQYSAAQNSQILTAPLTPNSNAFTQTPGSANALSQLPQTLAASASIFNSINKMLNPAAPVATQSVAPVLGNKTLWLVCGAALLIILLVEMRG